MEELKKTFWSIEELIYFNYEDEDIYNNKEKEIIENISILFKDGFCDNLNECIDIELNEKSIKQLNSEISNFFSVLKLFKSANHKKCIIHPWLYEIFKFIIDILKNNSVNTIFDVKKEIFQFFYNEKKEKNIKYKNNFFFNSCFTFFYEIKILLCCCIFLNVFVQYNWTGPPLYYNFKKLEVENIKRDDSDNNFKEFIEILNSPNEKFLKSCLEFLSLEGEYIYEYSELINCFCMCIILLGIVNNFNEKDQHIFSMDEYNYFKKNLNDSNKQSINSDNDQSVFHSSINEKKKKTANYKNDEYVSANCEEERYEKGGEGEEGKKESIYDDLKLLHFIKSKYLWKARIYFIWQRLFASNSDYFYFLKTNIVDKPIEIFKNIKLLPKEFELIEQEVNIRTIDVFDHLNENKKDIKFCDLFFENCMSEKFKIYILSNFTIYLAFYNYTSGHDKLLTIISEISQFYYSFTGRMGIKRKYQKIPATILVLKTKLKDQEDNTSTILREIDPFSEYDILKSDYKIIENETKNEQLDECRKMEIIGLESEDNKSLKREDVCEENNEKEGTNRDQTTIIKKDIKEYSKNICFDNNGANNRKIEKICCDNNSNLDKNIIDDQNDKLYQVNDNYKKEDYKENNNEKKDNNYNSDNEELLLKKFIPFKNEKMINISEGEYKENNSVTLNNIHNKENYYINNGEDKNLNSREINCSEKNRNNMNNYLEGSNTKVTWKLKDLDPNTDILEEPYFIDSQNNYFKILSFQEQIILINYCFSMIRFNPHYDEIKFEKLSAVISRCLKCYEVNTTIEKKNEKNNNYLLQTKFQNWLLNSCILWFKCKYETCRLKTVDRAASQLNELLKECYELKPENIERLKFIYDVYYPTTWEMKKEIGNVMIKVGSMVSAFNIFKDLKLWEEAITCLIEADRKEEAKELLDNLLEKKKTPSLLFLYGLINGNNAMKFYEDSWNLSNCKYAKAARYIGKHYYNKEMYKECCEYLEKALEISPLFPDIWFILGCSYMKTEKADEAIRSFTRVISMTNEDSGKAYGNLAYLYMKKGTYKAAKICINQAVKVNNSEWKYWDTYLKLSILQNDIDSYCLSLITLCKLNRITNIQPWMFDYISDIIVQDKPTLVQNKNGLSYLDKIIATMDNISSYITEHESFWSAYSFFLFIKGKFDDSFNAKIREIRSIESKIQKYKLKESIEEILVSKQIAAIKFLYHIIKTHYVGEKNRTFKYQLKNIIDSTLIQYKNISQEDINELSQIKEILC